MFYLNENGYMRGVPTKEALELKKQNVPIFNHHGKEATITEIEDFIKSKRVSIYDLQERRLNG